MQFCVVLLNGCAVQQKLRGEGFVRLQSFGAGPEGWRLARRSAVNPSASTVAALPLRRPFGPPDDEADPADAGRDRLTLVPAGACEQKTADA